MASNVELHQRREAAVPRGVANAFPVYADRAENAELWDIEGNRYIDFAGGIAVLNTGHRLSPGQFRQSGRPDSLHSGAAG